MRPQSVSLPDDMTLDNRLVRVEHVTHTIITRAQTTTILDDVTFSIPAQQLSRSMVPQRAANRPCCICSLGSITRRKEPSSSMAKRCRQKVKMP